MDPDLEPGLFGSGFSVRSCRWAQRWSEGGNSFAVQNTLPAGQKATSDKG